MRKQLAHREYDVFIAGGGINGAVSAAALAGMGAAVALVDRGDFAGGTSQESSCLVWGGIKYLEGAELRLVRELCRSRNALLSELPDFVRETRFLAPHDPGFRHGAAMLRLGTWLYWWLGGNATRRPAWHGAKALASLEAALPMGLFDGAVEYSDGLLSDGDARLVMHFIQRADDGGAACLNYAELLESSRDPGGKWVLRVRDGVDGEEFTVKSRVFINAAGPWAGELNEGGGIQTKHRLLLSKGVHLVVREIADPSRVLAFFGDDGRLFFVIPFGGRSLVGTTDTRVDHVDEAFVTPGDRRFILRNLNKRLRLASPLTEADILSERCGVRPLAVAGHRGHDADLDWMRLSRRHVVEVDARRRHLTLFGGKLTDCLNLGAEVVREVRHLGVLTPHAQAEWWRTSDHETREKFLAMAAPRLSVSAGTRSAQAAWASRLWMRYGAAANQLFPALAGGKGAGFEIFPDSEYLWAEAGLARTRDRVVHLDDLLRRRTRLALRFAKSELAESKPLRELNRKLFGKDAGAEWERCFGR
ncbi:MAG: FAD-dependent oxidoreductase [Spirochaetes bacterium]|nr:FAD-dependent oxidoreductase [Spirochaetota bacterium]